MAEFHGGSFEEFIQMLMAHARKGAERDRHNSDDPAEYDRAVQVVDDRALLLTAAFDRKREQLADAIEEAQERCGLLSAELDALRAQMFAELRRLYPEVKARGGCSGVRHWQRDVYYVGWDEEGVGR